MFGRVKLETLFSQRPRWNFNLITALSRNRTRFTEVKGTCANHRTTDTPRRGGGEGEEEEEKEEGDGDGDEDKH